MQGRPGYLLALAVLCGILFGLLGACSMTEQDRDAVGRAVSGPPPTAGREAVAEHPYTLEPEPLTVADCGRCHTFHFRQLSADGQGHRIDCRECHLQFHAYNPMRDNFAELMPKCGQCHANPHNDEHSACLSCHQQPHAPRLIPFSESFVSLCSDCHNEQESQLQQFPSAHAEQGCQACHPANHGNILPCLDCHDAHYEAQSAVECAGCHPAHKPLRIVFNSDDHSATCRECHAGVVEKLQQTPSRHGQLNCADCHAAHSAIPACAECHPSAHEEAFLSRFPDCLSCHLDAHDLPVK